MKIAILGGGVSGLTAARLLHDSGHDVTVYESEAQPGGLSRSRQVGDYIFNIGGGHSLSPKKEQVIDWVFSVMPKQAWNYRSRAAKIFFSGQHVSYPFELSLFELPMEVAVDCVYDYMLAQQGPMPGNFRDWLKWNFGSAIAEHYMLPYNAKIWAYPLEQMETQWVQGKMPLPDKKDILRSLILRRDPHAARMPHTYFYYPMSGGIQSFINTVAAPLHVHASCPVEAIERTAAGGWKINGGEEYTHVICTIPLPHLLRAMQLPQAIQDSISGLRYNGLTTIFFACPDNGLTDLYIPEQQYRAHRICFSGLLAPDAAPAGENCGGAEIIGPPFAFDADCLQHGAIIPREIEAGSVLDSAYSEFAYVIHDLDYRKNTATIREYFSAVEGFDLLGRWGEWNYNNMDLCMQDAIALVEQRFHRQH